MLFKCQSQKKGTVRKYNGRVSLRSATTAGAGTNTSTSVSTTTGSAAARGIGPPSSVTGPSRPKQPTNGSIRQANLAPSTTRARVAHHHYQHSQQQQQQNQQNKPSAQQRGSASARALLSKGGPGESLRRSDDLAGQRSASGSAQDLCDNSNDSGLGFEERQQQLSKATAWSGSPSSVGGEEDTKRRKMDMKLESEDANFAFPDLVQGGQSNEIKSRANGIVTGGGRANAAGGGVNGSVGRVIGPAGGVHRPRPGLGTLSKRSLASGHQGPVTLNTQLSNVSRNGKVQLQIICQPEQQHRARYQTEGSRGAVKDRTGNGFPIVRLVGYDKPVTLQVFIGTDLGRVVPHMFYQACRVSGKNSTPCTERKVDGTIVIEVDMDPLKDMLVTCDCVGILKERNVDVEHRFPHEAGILQGRSKKKSTRCRMVFRASITHDDGATETLQICSQPIVCTQPPGIPEICKKSLTSCPCTGGLELFILGKNFLKDTRVVFQLDGDELANSLEPHWECTVVPDKEFLQQTHLVCVVPPYRRQDLDPAETIGIKLYAISSGKTSEPHAFVYTAASAPPAPSLGKLDGATVSLVTTNSNDAILAPKLPPKPLVVPNQVATADLLPVSVGSTNFLGAIQSTTVAAANTVASEVLKNEPSPPPVSVPTPVTPVMLWSSQQPTGPPGPVDVMMPPPNSIVAGSLMGRRPSAGIQLIMPDNLKTEVLDENSESSLMGENSLPGMPNGPTATSSGGLEHLVSENSRDASQAGLLRSTVTTNGSPVQDGLLGVVDLMRGQHPMALVPQQSAFAGLQEASQVKVLSPHRINKDNGPILGSDASLTNSMQNTGVVDLRMKHHQSEFNGIGNGSLGSFAITPADQPLPAQTGQSIEKYLNQIESTPKKPEEANFVRASIIATGQQQQQQQQQQQPTSLLASASAAVPLDNLVDNHQIVSPLGAANSSPNTMISQVTSDTIVSPQQATSSPALPVKNMLLEALMPTTSISPLSVESNSSVVANVSAVQVQDPSQDNSLLKSINTALLPSMQDSSVTAVGAAATSVNPNVSVTSHNTLQVTANEVIPSAVATMALVQDTVSIQQQVQQVEQVVAQAAQQVEQVVAQAQQQAVQAVQQAQQQVVHQVVAHAQAVQMAVKNAQTVAPTEPEVQQVMQQVTHEVVQQAVQQATHEVVQQVQAVQQAVQQAQAAQAMQQAVQQDISSMLNQPAGFVAEASSALASGASQEPSQQRLTNEAEMAINSVITNATQDIINNTKPITTTTAHAIIATKNILNSVATESAKLMNSAMEGILPKSPTASQTIVEQVACKSPTIGSMQMQAAPNDRAALVGQQPVPMQQQPTEPQPQVVPQINAVVRRADGNPNGMISQELMTDHDLLNYLNSGCFDPQSGFLI
ncbi:nuclear factor of activated T-cells 5-like isoform X2 [Copidosoma floridanum]|uniref:nuclear factor of activated T-cells 5-like isoform X2 n=1 Tax=Copidosoma floridanum TaxID=29053 RepID=UPI0006C98BD0|nr:nuclear factor of activated T-cells 5-like isoform X2 [Copidosoma floridanum]